jgi:hypothetical protein
MSEILRDKIATHLFLEFSVLFLGLDEVKENVKCSCEDEGQEKRESCEVSVSLSAAAML